jgi:hypothetical protein
VRKLDEDDAQTVNIEALLGALPLPSAVRLRVGMSIQVMFRVVSRGICHLVRATRAREIKAREVWLAVVHVAIPREEEEHVVASETLVQPVYGVQVEETVTDGVCETDSFSDSRFADLWVLKEFTQRNWRTCGVEIIVRWALKDET